jgi:hypothetical protein
MRTVADEEAAVSLVRGDPLFRLQRAVRLIPQEGLGVARRALLLALVTWLPIAVWAVLASRAVAGTVQEPLLAHFGVHVRCLLAIPLFVIAEGVAHGVTSRLLPQFLRAGLVREADRERFFGILRGVVRLRDATLPWMLIGGGVAAWTFVSPVASDVHELTWAGESDAPLGFGFGGWWFLVVARPIYLALLLGWLWRLALLTLLLVRVARLDLDLVPTHPDGAGGLGFLAGVPTAFAPVVLGMSAVLASRWAHDVVYHEVHVAGLRLPMAGFAILVVLVFLAPLFVLMPRLAATKRAAKLPYAALVGEHGRRVRRRWILGERVEDDPLLGAPEIGPVADTLALYDAVRRMRPFPFDRQSIFALALPAAIPMLALTAIEIPVKDILLQILKTLA